MNTNILVLAMLCLSTSLFGQLQIGIKSVYSTSLNSSMEKEFVSVSPAQIHNISFEGTRPRTSIGLSLYTENKNVFVSSDVMYATSGRDFTLKSTSYNRTPIDPSVKYQSRESSVRMVVNAGPRLGDFKIGVGPEMNYLLVSEETLSEIDPIDVMDKKWNVGFNFLVGCKLSKHIHIDLKYTYIFQDVSNEFTYQGVPLDMRRNPKYFELGLATYL